MENTHSGACLSPSSAQSLCVLLFQSLSSQIVNLSDRVDLQRSAQEIVNFHLHGSGAVVCAICTYQSMEATMQQMRSDMQQMGLLVNALRAEFLAGAAEGIRTAVCQHCAAGGRGEGQDQESRGAASWGAHGNPSEDTKGGRLQAAAQRWRERHLPRSTEWTKRCWKFLCLRVRDHELHGSTGPPRKTRQDFFVKLLWKMKNLSLQVD